MVNFQAKDIISMNDLSKDEIDYILDKAGEIGHNPNRSRLLEGKVLASLFFEPSTRTRTSFEKAMRNLSGRVEGFADPKITSVVKRESLWDTIRIYDGYGYDVFVIRHPLKGAARLAAEAAQAPVINAGDGPNQHPTQTLLDLYTIRETQGTIDNISIAMVGDLENGRTVHSLTEALVKYEGCRLFFISSRDLAMPGHLIDKCRERAERGGFHFQELTHLDQVIDQVDIVYMTRIQRERFEGREHLYEKVKSIYRLDMSALQKVKTTMKVLHPLPRVDEISIEVDKTPYAYYFEQASNGLRVREALLALVTGVIQ
ncbi:MAG: aspartate carbamoyltransferase [Deltaproteobacteria bacterium]|nr:aspartate carbamoyltransferase [Deltaproteobacteria bacterium]MBW2307660.1 aspartate carbamoyltransferase [Deltaproteobacteria bacterium]